MHVSFQNSINKSCYSTLYWLKVVTHFFPLIYKDIDIQMFIMLSRAITLRISPGSIFSLKLPLLNMFLELLLWNGLQQEYLWWWQTSFLWGCVMTRMIIQRQAQCQEEEHPSSQKWGATVKLQSGPNTYVQFYRLPLLPSYTLEFSSLTSCCSPDSVPAIPPEWNGTVFLPDPSGTILLIHHAPAHIQPFCDVSPLPMRQNSTEGKNTDMRVQWHGSREAAAQLVMCMDHGARLPGSESCPYNVAMSSVILDELHHFPISQFPQQWDDRIKHSSYLKGLFWRLYKAPRTVPYRYLIKP